SSDFLMAIRGSCGVVLRVRREHLALPRAGRAPGGFLLLGVTILRISGVWGCCGRGGFCPPVRARIGLGKPFYFAGSTSDAATSTETYELRAVLALPQAHLHFP